ncbi:MAG: RES domain-containing protein [Thermomicrobiales bacterium]|nr:RES domain-containing protein [Thermomicrobiales bacterium]
MSVQLAPDPLVLHRIGRSPSPLAFPPLSSQGRGRYDDPAGRVAVLYAAGSRRGAFMETLDQYRFDIATMAEAQSRTGGPIGEEPLHSFGTIPRSFFHRLSRLARSTMARRPRSRDPRDSPSRNVQEFPRSEHRTAAHPWAFTQW